jgi:hypothetical protein
MLNVFILKIVIFNCSLFLNLNGIINYCSIIIYIMIITQQIQLYRQNYREPQWDIITYAKDFD